MLKRLLLTSAAILLPLATIDFQAKAQSQQQPTPRPQQESRYVDFSGFKGKVFEIKNIDPHTLVPVLHPLGSGFKGATIEASREFKTIMVRDFPENIAVIEEAIKRLDVPRPKGEAPPREQDIDLTVYVLIGSNEDLPSNPTPNELKDVLKQLQATLTYKSYLLLTTVSHRTKVSARGNNGAGSAQLKVPNVDRPALLGYDYQFDQINPESKGPGSKGFFIRDFHFRINSLSSNEQLQFGSSNIRTSLSINDGEKLVVGTASLRDKAMILVLSAKTVN